MCYKTVQIATMNPTYIRHLENRDYITITIAMPQEMKTFRIKSENVLLYMDHKMLQNALKKQKNLYKVPSAIKLRAAIKVKTLMTLKLPCQTDFVWFDIRIFIVGRPHALLDYKRANYSLNVQTNFTVMKLE